MPRAPIIKIGDEGKS